jgi:hypothetical protein
MQIELRNTIEKAIRDREALYESMLQGEIKMEDEILRLLKKRYEVERDLILDGIKARIEALKEEKKAIDENLRKRKEENDWAKKQMRLLELEQQKSRIAADPTRAREVLAIQEEIDKLREEMAWDLADKEAEAQKESIDQQITSLEDYQEYVKKYYDDLFKYPQKLIEEMRRIIEMSDEEILEWLKKNDEDYANSSARRQESMTRSWQATLNEMHGYIVTYWDEVESIIQQGDEAIIAFLKANSADYRAAGELQAQAYVDAWRTQLANLQAAMASTYQAMNSYNYQPTYTDTYIPPSTGSSGSGSTSSGSGSSGGSTAKKWKFTFNGSTYTGFATKEAATAKLWE